MKINKKLFTLLTLSPLAMTLLVGCGSKGNETLKEMITTSKDLTTINQDAAPTTYKINVSFEKGIDDIAYVALKDIKPYLEVYFDKEAITIETDTKNQKVTITRPSVKSTMVIDFKNDTFLFSDYNAFITNPIVKYTNLDLVMMATKENDNTKVLVRDKSHMSYTPGSPKEIDLSSYGIDLIWSKDEGYIPLQVLSDLVFNYFQVPMIFNGEQLFALPIALLGQPNFRDAYYKNKKEKTMRSNELAQFTYKTFCLNLDLNYGLKESHFVTSNFDDYFTRLGLKEDLLSLDPDKSTQAMVDLVSFVFDDGHSSFAMSSFNNPEPQVTQRATSSAARDLVYSNNIKTLLEKYQIEPEVPSYTEVGDTAFVYFQRFNVVNPNFYSPETVPSEENMWFMLLNDTLGLVQHAHHMITRENSPIKNVVIDLSNNIGGAIDAAAYVATWLTGENLVLEGQVRDFIPGQISYVNKCTNATLTQGYLADINLDHKFDDKDILSTYNKNIYCLTSKSSFSCGNLIPSILKDTKKATLIGQTTGGVTCAVFPISTADGTILNISGPYQLSSVKNGSYYSIDQGITPDVFIRDLKELYENDGATPRGKIINLIKGLK